MTTQSAIKNYGSDLLVLQIKPEAPKFHQQSIQPHINLPSPTTTANQYN